LTVIYSAESTAPNTASRATLSGQSTSRPSAMMPLLVILFIVSYGILTMLVFEQGQTIESQRSLIREMLKDSTQLAALKDRLARDDGKRVNSHDKAAVTADQKKAESGNHGDGVAGAKGSDAKGLDKETKRPGKSTHSTKQVPEWPAADLEDVRRSTRVI